MVKYLGKISREDVNRLYGKSRAGIILYQPAKNHFESQPIKLFEFMAAGLPVIASDFPLWKEIIEDNKCGICVNPADINEIRAACVKLLCETELGKQMGIEGRKAILQKYNWDYEKDKLLNLYQELLKNEKQEK